MDVVCETSKKKLSEQEIMELDVENLGLNRVICSALKRIGIIKVKDLFTPKPKETEGSRIFGRKALEKVLKRLIELGLELDLDLK